MRCKAKEVTSKILIECILHSDHICDAAKIPIPNLLYANRSLEGNTSAITKVFEPESFSAVFSVGGKDVAMRWPLKLYKCMQRIYTLNE
jgi:hypothetical protein